MTIKAQTGAHELIAARDIQVGQRIKVWGEFRRVHHLEIRVVLDDSAGPIHVFQPHHPIELESRRP